MVRRSRKASVAMTLDKPIVTPILRSTTSGSPRTTNKTSTEEPRRYRLLRGLPRSSFPQLWGPRADHWGGLRRRGPVRRPHASLDAHHLTAILCGCTTPVKVSESPLILLVSFDTTRADTIGAYGGEGAVTPNLDALADRGVRFDQAMTPLPTTLGSHTSMMSGLDTHGHGVPRNGVPVPESVPLLAEKLAAAGWDRIAAVGAIPLDARMGLNRGFRVYKDMVRRPNSARLAARVRRSTRHSRCPRCPRG